MTTNRTFIPFVGRHYSEGLKSPDSTIGKKTLVLGASFYCDKTHCPFFTQCTSTAIKDSRPFDARCPEYQPHGKFLHDEPSWCIEDQPITYRTFARTIGKYLGNEDYTLTWDYVAFTNYVQFFLPSDGKSFRPTRHSDLDDRDFEAFLETVRELQPEVIIVWGCVINQKIMWNNPYANEIDRSRNEEYIGHLKLDGVPHEVTLVNPFHPSSPRWYQDEDKFLHYLNLALMQ